MSLVDAGGLTLRRAQSHDARRVYEWRNDPVARQASRDRNELSWETHADWFASAVVDPRRLLLIAECPSGAAVGICRFDLAADGASAVVSINLAADQRGKGLGSRLLKAAIEALVVTRSVTRIVAQVRPENVASMTIFQRLGFQIVEEGGELTTLEWTAGAAGAIASGHVPVHRSIAPARCTLVVECGPTVGLGHLKRCLVMASALQRAGMRCSFIVGDPSGVGIAASSGFSADCDVGLSKIDRQADVVVLDGYRFEPSLPRAWRMETNALIVLVDDLGERPCACDMVVNHNLYGAGIDYAAYGARTVLAGPEYALVEPAFVALRGEARPKPPHVLVSFGGSDDGRYALAVAKAIIRCHPTVIVEVALSPLLAASRAAAARESNASDRLIVHAGCDMPAVMVRAGVYVGAAGVTCMEAIAAGLEVVACGIAANQSRNIETLAQLGYATFASYDPERLAQAAVTALSGTSAERCMIVDGRGADRLAAAVAALLPRASNKQSVQSGDLVA